jgi:outer membrane protein assembly factor BamB
MTNTYTKLIIALFAASFLFTSCSKNYSKDDPLQTIYAPSIIISSDNQFVYAFDPQTSAKHWEFNVGDKVVASPLLYKGTLYVPTFGGTVYELNAKTGKLQRTLKFKGSLYATPIADGDLIYYPIAGSSAGITAIDIATDTIRWTTTTGGQVQSSPTILNNQLIYAGYDGNVYSVNKTNGTSMWSYNTGAANAFYSSPAVSGPYVYIGGLNGIMYCINNTTGNLRWAYTTKGSIESSPTVYSGNCIFGSDDYHFYCIDTATGKPRWIDTLGDRVISSPTEVGNVIYVGCFDYNFYAVNVIDGSIKWKLKTTGLIKSSPLLYGPYAYIGGYDKNFYALDTATGNVIWKENINGVIECSPLVDDLSGITQNNSGISGYTN